MGDTALSVQELATSTFVQYVVELNADKSASAIKYKQVLSGGGNGKNWLWYDFDIGAWKLGSGLVTDTGLLLQVLAPNSFEVDALAEGSGWSVWDGRAWNQLPASVRIVTTGLGRDCESLPEIDSTLKHAPCNSSAGCGFGGACSGFQSCKNRNTQDNIQLDLDNFSSPIWRLAQAPSAPSSMKEDPAALLEPLKFARHCEQRAKPLSLGAAHPFDSSDDSFQAGDAFKAREADLDLMSCIWMTCGQTQINPGAYLLKTALVPDGVCQSKCKEAWCKWASKPLAGKFGFLGCSVTEFSNDCKVCP